MTFKHKLAARLARLRDCSMLVALVVALACSAGDSTAPTTGAVTGSDLPVVLAPRSVTLEANQSALFKAYDHGSTSADSLLTSIEWTASGGNIASNGQYSSTSTGQFYIVGKKRGQTKSISDTAVVVIVPSQPNLVSMSVSPASATVQTSGTASFTATGKLSDGSSVAIGVVWSATGGTVDAGGNFVAGSTAGSFSVIAKAASSNVADTIPVTVTAVPAPTPTPSPTPAPPPPPAGLPSLDGSWGLSLKMDQPFSRDLTYPNTLVSSTVGRWYAYPGMSNGSNGGTLTLFDDNSSPASPGKTLRVTFPTGQVAGSAPAGFGGWAPDYAAAPSTNIYREIYVSMWIKIGDGNGFENHPVGTKLAYWGFGEDPSVGIRQGYMLWENTSGTQGVQTSGRLVFFSQNVVARRFDANAGGSPTMRTGAWHQIEFHCRQNSSPGVADGLLEVWLDGQKTHNYTDVLYRTSLAPYGFSGWKGDPVWGGFSGPVKTRTDYIYYDQVTVYGK